MNVRRFLTKVKIIFIFVIIDSFRILFYNLFSSKEIEISFILFKIKIIEFY